MLSELTQKQKNLMIEVRNEWIKKIERPNDLTVEKVKPHIEWLYEFCGLEKPKVIVADSPFACQIASNLCTVDQFWYQRDDLILKKICRKVWGQIHDQIEEQFSKQVGKQVGKEVGYHAFMLVYWQVEKCTRDQVLKPVDRQVENSLEKLRYIHFCVCGDMTDASWCSFYDYFSRLGVIKSKHFDRYLEYLDSGIFHSIQLKDMNIVCGNPEYIDRDPATGELHSEDRMAIKWKDGWGLYFLRGVAFDEDLWEKVTSKTCDLKTILSIQNTEQRMAALSLEYNRLLLLNQMVEIDKKSMFQTNANLETVEVEYILYQLPQSVGIFDENSYFVFTTCPSTGRQYLEGVDPAVGVKGDVLECVASQFQISKEEFLNIGQHS